MRSSPTTTAWSSCRPNGRARPPRRRKRARPTRATSAPSSPPACSVSTCTRCASRSKRQGSNMSTEAAVKDAAKPVTGPFEKTKGWLDWFEGPSKPSFSLPRGSVDAHCHVFGPGAEFPYAPERKYTPCDASKARLFALRDHLGFARNVIVQATCHGADNSAMVDALFSSGGKARGIATVRSDVSDAELNRLHQAGVRGVRFNFVKRLVDFTPKEEQLAITERIIEHDWHIGVHFEAKDLPELSDFLSSLPATIVVDHMGRPDVTKPVDGPEFARFLRCRDA